jgi:hypothetical protein
MKRRMIMIKKTMTEEEAEKIIQGRLDEQYGIGLRAGAYAMCYNVLEKAQNRNLSVEERLNDIITFCTTSIGGKINDK